MKCSRIIITLVFVSLTFLLLASPSAGQSSSPAVAVPTYNKALETTFKGTVEEVRDRQCPMSGGMGTHLLLKVGGNTIEVHLATTKFVKSYDLVFKKGDAVQVVGTKVQFEGVETIFAREVIRGGDTFVFRDKDGAPVW